MMNSLKQIKKRDGRIVDFNRENIVNAIEKSFISVDGTVDDYAKAKANNIADFIEEKASNELLGVEDIQDLVENGLMNTRRKDVARAYITYRNERTRVRESNSDLIKIVSEKLNATNVQNQNANVDEKSFGGRMGEANDAMTRKYAIDYCLSPKAKYNHLHNRIYIHDLSHYAIGDHNCLSIPFDKLLKEGFNTRQTDVRGAQSIGTALQLYAVIFQLQSLNQFGGVSSTHMDWTLVPYIRKTFLKKYIVAWIKDQNEFVELDIIKLVFEDYTDEVGVVRNKFDDWIDENKSIFFEKTGLKEEDFYLANKENLDPKYYQSALYDTIVETKQGVEGFFHNMNTLQSRSGNQLPFTSVNFGTCTSIEGRIIIKALLETCIKGIGKLHKTSIFPCSIFQYMKGVNDRPGTPNYDLFKLAIKSTSQRLYPNYANVDWSGNEGYDRNDPCTYFSTMGKRKLQPI